MPTQEPSRRRQGVSTGKGKVRSAFTVDATYLPVRGALVRIGSVLRVSVTAIAGERRVSRKSSAETSAGEKLN